MVDQQLYRQVARWLRQAGSAVAFTGAGISTESGIPDFRSPGGVWERYQPVMYQDFVSGEDARREYWRQKCESHRNMMDARPNAGHRVLADWEREGLLTGVITQNIDGLHQVAGSRRVLELHGTARWIACLACDRRYDPEPLVAAFQQTGEVPACPECGGMLKHATVSFGQSLPRDVLDEAIRMSRSCDLFFALGSSLVVEPAASLPPVAKTSGARLVIINRDATSHDANASAVLHASIGEALSAIDGYLRREQ
jgi:NAD-dependent deacetylase